MRHSPCSLIHPVHLPYIARLFGIDGFAITEHDYLWEDDDIQELKREAGIDEIVILRGQEIRTYNEDGPAGDILVFGYPDTIDGPINPEELIDKVRSCGAVAIAAHPYRNLYGLGDKVFDLGLDGIEVYNSNHSAFSTQEAVKACKSLSLPAIGASDAHDLVHLGQFLTLFERPVTSEADLVTEIKARRCRPILYSESPSFSLK
jgi:predicted metal-dependent phosphoesterase TrpH